MSSFSIDLSCHQAHFFSSHSYDKFLRMQYFNIQVASQLSGVASATIRAWEKRYNAVVPERGDNKHRLYSEQDIEKLAILFQLTEFGQSIGKIAHLDLEKLKEIYTTLMQKPYEEINLLTPHHEKVDTKKVLSNLYLAISAYKLDIVSHELDKTKDILGPRELCLEVLAPLFLELSQKVARGELTLAQERAFNAIASFYMGQMIGRHYQKKLSRNELVLIGTPEGEQHSVGILAAALLCIHYGIPFVFLGPSLPVTSLSDAANALKATAIFMSSKKNESHYIKELTQQLSEKTEIWIGGAYQKIMEERSEARKMFHFYNFREFDKFLSDL